MSDSGSTPSADSAKPLSPSSGSLAFLVHSPDTVQRNLPPDVDNKPLARQKRRRTSPEDQKILEAEYSLNSKPDKMQRQKIVERVALGEKEVQIWFQNRRQNTRRKSRPLEPHEVRSHLEASSQGLNSDTLFSSSSIPHSDDSEEGEDGTAVHDDEPKTEAESAHDAEPLLLAGIETAANDDGLPSSTQESTFIEPQQTHATIETRPTETPPIAAAVTEFSNSQPLPSSQPWPSSQESQKQGIGYLANRRSASFVRNYEEPALEKPVATPASPQEQAQPRTLRKTQSFVRLSMTEDGKARVINADDSSPSPPRSQPTPSTVGEKSSGFRRSYSGTALNDRLKQAQTPRTPLGLSRTSSGRSRDSRAWEFWCDSDARNSLTQKANQEGSGSAADAIGLIRATSKSALTPSSNKRTAPLLPQSSAKRQRTDGKTPSRPPLSRSSSSLGRLQGGRAAGTSRTPLKKTQSVKVPRTKDGDGFEVPQTESDKENWEPSLQSTSTRRRQPAHSQQRRRVLGENTNIMSTNSSLGAMMEREKGVKAAGKRAPNPEEDGEIAAFMGSARGSNQRPSVSSGEELGCVQGLLKLSQGNWR
ncbi:uncharacterized protein K452DRAFT_273338 [Aplosporella prunicola CBS 121167]|uniref:Homeobox domain-containing protein n=1 Tax=Aplosporella prunicola CBS 121167 TaxID=1176127 RepID=A0A6A6BAL6_9PEZI|nr:uncharacterized protein K452DRAFT_273338 [Aplosporella prunicola CBS 121167]KAF2140638.1 hypothetical protein K452DRAFT_273338 [Aplosporella prunicola CBS 121167]